MECSYRKKDIWSLKKLFNDIRKENSLKQERDSGTYILKEEVRHGITQFENGKAAGSDNIQADFIKLLDEPFLKRLTSTFNIVYKAGRYPQTGYNHNSSEYQKKPNAEKCEDYRPISLMNHVLKIFLRILHRRIYKICQGQIAHNQFGFFNAVGTRGALNIIINLYWNQFASLRVEK